MLGRMRQTPESSPPMWDRIGELLSVRFSWVIALLVALIGVGLMGALGENGSADNSPVSLPPSAESA